eukprot:984387-Rhodomonas_salina.2
MLCSRHPPSASAVGNARTASQMLCVDVNIAAIVASKAYAVVSSACVQHQSCLPAHQHCLPHDRCCFH